jgi:hypothetical protein
MDKTLTFDNFVKALTDEDSFIRTINYEQGEFDPISGVDDSKWRSELFLIVKKKQTTAAKDVFNRALYYFFIIPVYFK